MKHGSNVLKVAINCQNQNYLGIYFLEEYKEAIKIAKNCLDWAKKIIKENNRS